MVCPFRKKIVKYNEYGHKVSSSDRIAAITETYFSECSEEKCAGWDKKNSVCALCQRGCVYE